MSYIKYKKISYILSETPNLSGKMAFEFLDKIIEPDDVLKFIFYGHGRSDQSLDWLVEMNNSTIISQGKNGEKEFFIKNININSSLLDVLCSLGNFPSFLIISKINFDLHLSKVDFCWRIEYCDESFSFVFLDEYIDSSKIILIEQELKNKGISFERKKEKSVKLKNKNRT